MAVTVDVVHDTVCPWCRVGKRHLDDAIAAWAGEAPVVRWHPFLLNPAMPAGGVDFRGYMASIKGDANVEPMIAGVTEAGRRAGLAFDWGRVGRAPNTLLSHALIAAAPEGRQGEVLDAVHRAYFQLGVDIGDRDELAAIAGELGLDAGLLNDRALLDAVAGRAEAARYQGISGVPLFVFDGRTAVSGAQPAGVLLAAIEEAEAAGANVRS